MSNHFVLECRQLAKIYHDGQVKVDVFKEINFAVKPGEQVAIMGCSGTGKSTLLHLLGGLDTPTSGEILLEGEAYHTFSEKTRSRVRNQKLGFIYQLHHLLPEFTVLENVCLPMLLQDIPHAEIQARALMLLERVGLQDRVKHRITELSGGERQRTAIVRALINQPVCVLADEPTGNLDPQTALKVYNTMLTLNREANTSFVIVTHDQSIADKMDRILILRDGKLSDSRN